MIHKDTKQAAMIGLDLIQCYKPPVCQQQISSVKPGPTNAKPMNGFSILSNDQDIAFLSISYGLADKLIKSDPPA